MDDLTNFETDRHKAAWKEWTGLIDECGNLRRALGLRPWQFRAWKNYCNPHPPGPEHDAFARVQQRGIELDERLDALREVMDAEHKIQVEVRIKAARDKYEEETNEQKQ